MGILDSVREWFRDMRTERRVLFILGLIYSSCMKKYIMSIFTTFLTDVWNLNLKRASIIINVAWGLKNFLEIFAGFLIDACIGDRWMLIVSSMINIVGLVLLSRSVPGIEPCFQEEVICYAKLKASPFYFGLALIIVGGAAQATSLCTLSFGQLKLQPLPPHPRTESYACFTFAVVEGERRKSKIVLQILCLIFKLAGILTGIIGFASSSNWTPEFRASAIAFGVGLLLFLCSFPIYTDPELQPSPLSTMLRVFVAAMRKRRLNENTTTPYHVEQRNQQVLTQQPTPTNHLRRLNKAAIRRTNDPIVEMSSWRDCTVEDVEHTKTLLGMIPMAITFISYGMVKSFSNTYFIEQANKMDRNFNFGPIASLLPIASLKFVSEIASSLVNWLYKRIMQKRIDETGRTNSDGVKIGLGMLASIVCCAVASLVEAKRLKILGKLDLSNKPDAVAQMSVLWLVPQFFLLGTMDALAADGIKDFFDHHVPLPMKRYAPIFKNVLIGCGVIFIIGFEAMLDQYNKSRGRGSWIGNSINESHVDYLYRALVAVTILNLFIYAFIATRYPYQNVEAAAAAPPPPPAGNQNEQAEEAAEAEGNQNGEAAAAEGNQNEQAEEATEAERNQNGEAEEAAEAEGNQNGEAAAAEGNQNGVLLNGIDDH